MTSSTAGSACQPPPGLGVDLNVDEIRKHPYSVNNHLPLFRDGWERRVSQEEVTS